MHKVLQLYGGASSATIDGARDADGFTALMQAVLGSFQRARINCHVVLMVKIGLKLTVKETSAVTPLRGLIIRGFGFCRC